MDTSDDAKGSNSESILNHERSRGIFTTVDRRFIKGDKEYDSRREKYERRKAIRQRAKDGIIDLHHLLHIEDDEREKIFTELDQADLELGLESLIGFAYLGFDGDIRKIEWCVETGLNGWFGTLGPQHYADVEIDVEYIPDADEIEERFRKGERLSAAEKGILLEEGRITEEDLADLQRPEGPENPLMDDPRPMTPQQSTEGKESKRDPAPPKPSELLSEESDSDSDE